MPFKIINMLKESPGFVSGEAMSKRLGITRAAVWKKIKELRGRGFQIQSSTQKGYRLLKTPDFSIEELRTIDCGDLGREIVFHNIVDSTNTAAMELAEKGAPHGTVVIADRQLKGRGRLGRTWVSPPRGNIYMSVILRPGIGPRDATMLTILPAIACAKAIRDLTGLQVNIKWPNDLMVSDRKLGGILSEIKSDPDRIIFAVAGIGINVNVRIKVFPPEVRAVATSIKEELGKGQSRTLLVAGLLKEFELWYKVLSASGRDPLLREWRGLLSTLGRKVSVVAGRETFTGIAEDIDDEGFLILRLPSGGFKKISAGDLTILR